MSACSQTPTQAIGVQFSASMELSENKYDRFSAREDVKQASTVFYNNFWQKEEKNSSDFAQKQKQKTEKTGKQDKRAREKKNRCKMKEGNDFSIIFNEL